MPGHISSDTRLPYYPTSLFICNNSPGFYTRGIIELQIPDYLHHHFKYSFVTRKVQCSSAHCTPGR